MKTWKECCSEVAQKHNLGDQLVTGHKSVYYEEAAKMYAREVLQWVCDNGWESNPPIWSNGESMSDITGRSTYDEKSTEELIELYEKHAKETI